MTAGLTADGENAAAQPHSLESSGTVRAKDSVVAVGCTGKEERKSDPTTIEQAEKRF